MSHYITLRGRFYIQTIILREKGTMEWTLRYKMNLDHDDMTEEPALMSVHSFLCSDFVFLRLTLGLGFTSDSLCYDSFPRLTRTLCPRETHPRRFLLCLSSDSPSYSYNDSLTHPHTPIMSDSPSYSYNLYSPSYSYYIPSYSPSYSYTPITL